ncbi:unnamed protein product [Closterium sp. NIES-54]
MFALAWLQFNLSSLLLCPLPIIFPSPTHSPSPLSLCAPPAALLHSALYSLLPQQYSTTAAHGSSAEGEGAQGIPQERPDADSQVGSGSGGGGGVAGAIERMEQRFMGSFGHLGNNDGGGKEGGGDVSTLPEDGDGEMGQEYPEGETGEAAEKTQGRSGR